MRKKRIKEKKTPGENKWKSLVNRLQEMGKQLFHFLTYEIWRITENEVTGIRVRFYNLIKVIILSIRRYNEDELQHKASALTFYTLLSVVPVLAVIFGIAKGFGFQNYLQSQLEYYLEAQSALFQRLTVFIDSYLEHTKSGVFIGVGLILLFWTAMNLIGTIENSFNDIWQVKKGRTYWRKFTDYFSMLLILPILILASSGLSIFISTQFSQMPQFEFLSPLVQFSLRLLPYILTWILFTCLYIFIPNTKVEIKNAFIAGIVSGSAFQLFQFFYINGQIWVSKYNAIYGSFAAVPLLLLWLQLSWLIVLFGAELAFAGQNIEEYDFEKDSKRISKRFKDFIILIIASVITKRFAEGKNPYTIEEIAKENNIPLRLSKQIINQLVEVNIITEVTSDEDRTEYYQPAVDTSILSVGYLFEKLETHGSENFKIDKKHKFSAQWEKILENQKEITEINSHILLKDL